ncbi:hypothetical protein SAMN05444274_1255 [Mariniphaga anaerophila]|uniref:Uncharacterized protein n=1 Tax=Mariniphaga anaerophila TaxID=1484053 RepID=A0A1M5GK69_9BACT|nr:hypothetical protein [Mariniphaga anaerophila]SHG04134.1 hypothetical protein SAMN05444274_1255 [Mariniphaga anaerophila]
MDKIEHNDSKENLRLIKDYLLFPLIIGFILFSLFHYFDNTPKDIENSLTFGLKFAVGFALISGLFMIGGIKFLRPLLTTKYSRHRNLESFIIKGFKWNKEEEIYEGKYDNFDIQLFYSFNESKILKSEFHILVKFKQISREKHKRMKPGKRFANTVLFADFIQGNHEFILRPTSSQDLMDDIKNYCAYLRENNIKPLQSD